MSRREVVESVKIVIIAEDGNRMCVEGKGDRFFSAEALPCKGIEIEPGVFSGCDQSVGDCPECGK